MDRPFRGQMNNDDKRNLGEEPQDRPVPRAATEHISWTERLWPRQPPSNSFRSKAAPTTTGTRTPSRAGDSGPRPATASRRSPKKAIERLDPRETRLSFAAAAASVVFGVLVYVLEVEDKVHFTKNPDAPVTTLVLALACGVLLLVATLVRRRALVGFVALFAFLIFGTSSLVLGMPFLALAAWLLYRSYKIQKEASERTRQATSTGSGIASSRSKTAPAASAGSARGSATRGPTKSGPKAAEANKRYTPKRPPPKAAKPSWRERRAAQASD